LVFLATYNERPNIDLMLDAILGLPCRLDVLVVDDDSADGTGTVVKERATTDSRVSVLCRPRRLGIASAHRLGWLHARRFGYTRIVTMDADLSHDPSDIPRLLRAVDDGVDVALGSRFVPGGKLDYKGWRLFLSSAANRFARQLLQLPVAEYTNSYRAAQLDRVPVGLIETTQSNGYGFFLTATVRMARYGLRIAEIPIHFHDRHEGKSKMPKLQVLLGATDLFRLLADRRPFEGNDIDPTVSVDCGRCGGPYVIKLRSQPAKCLYCTSILD
jgi:dolichol-phosphate mannosyltransferase